MNCNPDVQETLFRYILLGSLSRMLKKSIPGLFQPRKWKTRFPTSFIFNGLRPSKMAAHPCTAHWASKNGVFQRPVREIL